MEKVARVGFSTEWERCYLDNTQMSVWPWSDVVSLVHRYCNGLISGSGRVLELGCGAGANIPFFQALGVDYFAVEGSPAIVKQLHQRYPDFIDQISVGDFTVVQPFKGAFDLVIDRAAITHNSFTAIKDTLESVLVSLIPGGIFIGSDWFSTKHSDYFGGEMSVDKYTRNHYTKGQFIGVGGVHFSDEHHLKELFSQFEILLMEEKIIKQYEPLGNHQFASWNIVARRSL